MKSAPPWKYSRDGSGTIPNSPSLPRELPFADSRWRSTKPDKTTVWKKVVVWERQAELCEVMLKKGNRVFVQGKGKLRTFTNDEGKTVTYEEITARLVGFTHLEEGGAIDK